jgi:moderate conductance mechanosensitive channel
MLQAPPADDVGLLDACGEDPAITCKAVWNATGNEVLAKLADWVIGKPLTALFIAFVAWLVSKLVRRWIRKAINRVADADTDAAGRALERVGVGAVVIQDPRRAARARSITTVVTSTVTVFIWVIAVLMIVGELGIDLGPLIAGAGIAGIALGFGAQNLVKDCVAGLFMLIEDQYGIGDAVDLGVASGSVEKITLRTTVARGQDGTVWHVPNGEIRRVGNRSKLWSVAVLDVVVAYDADLTAARDVIADVAARVTGSEAFAGDVLEAPEVLGVEAVSADGVTLRLLVKTEPGAQFRLQRALREAIKDGLDTAGVDVLPVPPREPAGHADRPPADGSEGRPARADG